MANRTVIFYKHYFKEFFAAQTPQVRKKIAQTLVWIQEVDRMPVSILRNIEGVKGLFEIRITFGGNIFRIFCCFDKGTSLCCSTLSKRKRRRHLKRRLTRPKD